jgi:hypothetical protein
MRPRRNLTGRKERDVSTRIRPRYFFEYDESEHRTYIHHLSDLVRGAKVIPRECAALLGLLPKAAMRRLSLISQVPL